MFLKLCLIFVTAFIYNHTYTQPQSPPTASEHKRTGTNVRSLYGFYEMAVVHVTTWTRISYWMLTASEAIAIASCYTDPGMNTTRMSPSSLEDIAAITPTFILGMTLILTGAAIRFLCFRKMSVHFTFQISLREKHKLVRIGPYSIVRHPAYTGGHMTILGGLLTLMGHGSWLYCGAGYSEKLGRVLCRNYCASVMVLGYALLRGSKEDVYLRREFGEEWERWARDVPYLYIPFVI